MRADLLALEIGRRLDLAVTSNDQSLARSLGNKRQRGRNNLLCLEVLVDRIDEVGVVGEGGEIERAAIERHGILVPRDHRELGV